MLNSFLAFFKDRLFPIFCLGCDQEGEWCCRNCRTSLPLFDSAESLAVPTASALSGLSALLKYEEQNLVARFIHAYKYQYIRELEGVWRELFQTFVTSSGLDQIPVEFTQAAIIPIPLHPRRERERGFNQAAQLAGIIASLLEEVEFSKKRVVTGLTRIVYTEQQARLNKAARHSNLAGAFQWVAPAPAPRQVILVDDVYTTGATLESAAMALRLAGATQIWAVTLARAVF